MTPSIIDLRTRRPVAVCAYKRSRPYDAQFIAKTEQLRQEVSVEQAMRDWAEAFPDDCLATLNDPTLGMYL